MYKCLESLNFGKDFIKWVKLFYKDIDGTIINNGNMSESFLIKCGVRQGCPLSCSLFICCLEIQASNIKKKKKDT